MLADSCNEKGPAFIFAIQLCGLCWNLVCFVCPTATNIVNNLVLFLLTLICFQVIAERLSDEEIAGLREMFKAVDIKSRGVITFGELRKCLTRYGNELEDAEISNRLEAVSSSFS